MVVECKRGVVTCLLELSVILFGVRLNLLLFTSGAINQILASAVEGRSLCNHRRAYKFFIDSVSPRCHFPAFPCDTYDNFLSGKCFPCTEERYTLTQFPCIISSLLQLCRKCGNMGYYADRSKGRGQLYLITREEEPFCGNCNFLFKFVWWVINVFFSPSVFSENWNVLRQSAGKKLWKNSGDFDWGFVFKWNVHFNSVSLRKM